MVPEKAPIRPEKARFSRKDFCPIFSENLGLKPPFVSPRLDFPNLKDQESAKGAGGKGARVINCHNFFFTPDRETRRIDHTTTELRHSRTKNATICDPGPLYAGPSERMSRAKKHAQVDPGKKTI